MARKTISEQLAKQIQQMMNDIEEHLKNCEALFKPFYEIYRSKRMVQLPLSTTQEKYPIIIFHKQPLGVNSTLLDREHNRLRILLYCPEKAEIGEEVDWFENEDEANSFLYQFRTINEFCRREAIIQENLLIDPMPIYEKAIKEWELDPDSSDIHAKNSKGHKKNSFAPQEGQTLAEAYEILKKSTRARSSKYKNNLRIHYKRLLEEALFKGISPDDPIRKSYLMQWEKNLFGQRKKSSSLTNNSELKQHRGIDRYTAGRCIAQLVDEFLNDPSKSHLGEAACILWILIWASQEKPYDITVKKVLNLSTQQISLHDSHIQFSKDNQLKISSGLHKLLLCLLGRGVGKRGRLFKHISNEKRLERILHNISQTLGFKPAILSASFSIPCHSYPGIRISIAQHRAMQNAPVLIPYSSRKICTQIKKIIKDLLLNSSFKPLLVSPAKKLSKFP